MNEEVVDLLIRLQESGEKSILHMVSAHVFAFSILEL